MEINILSEHEIEIYVSPELKIKQRVITYQVEGFAPKTLWIDSEKLPDAAYQIRYPAKPVPADIQAKGDAVRRVAIEADIAKLKQVIPPRKI